MRQAWSGRQGDVLKFCFVFTYTAYGVGHPDGKKDFNMLCQMLRNYSNVLSYRITVDNLGHFAISLDTGKNFLYPGQLEARSNL